MAYASDNRLQSVTTPSTTVTYAYDADGALVKKTVAGQTTVYVNGLYEVTPQGVTKYYYLGGQRVAMRQSGVLTYLHGDALGSASLATSVTGTVVSSMRYYPYGGTRSGSMATDRRYTGQRWEGSVGFYDYGARSYDPALGRFLQADSIVPNPANPQSLNRYSYVLNNPLRYIDPSGHIPMPGEGGPGCEDPLFESSDFGYTSTAAKILNAGIGLAELFLSAAGSTMQFAEVVGAMASDAHLPIGDVLGGGAALLQYKTVVDPFENFAGWTSFALTIGSDMMDGYTGPDFHYSSNPTEWEFVIGQNVVEDFAYATAGQTTQVVPIGLIDVGINISSVIL